METLELDRLDYRIMHILASDARSSDVAIGEAVGLSSNAAARRRRLLEGHGVIERYTAQFDLDRLGFGILVLVQMELVSQSDDALDRFEAAIQKCSAVSKCWFVSGDVDFLALVHVPSLHDFDETYRQELSSLPNVARIRSSFVLRSVIDRPTALRVLESAGRP
ncbi:MULTISPECIES: Lrp/AsnC family transcriptional regulator [unclassified Sphingopyxis]|uniref:Lrp/AsnC family transcriptional regulator n=1 Tax=Sphingopyxis sp. DBS4 TaxID=2968500 RepID=UPI00214BD459|nr:Lrp/AsnC family transcriptional regulator [Sphingopyxis sp. DBS4]